MFGRTSRTSVWNHFKKCEEKYTVCQLCKKSSPVPTMTLGAFSLLHNAIANNNGNDSTNHKNVIISVLYEQYCKLESVYMLQRKALYTCNYFDVLLWYSIIKGSI